MGNQSATLLRQLVHHDGDSRHPPPRLPQHRTGLLTTSEKPTLSACTVRCQVWPVSTIAHSSPHPTSLATIHIVPDPSSSSSLDSMRTNRAKSLGRMRKHVTAAEAATKAVHGNVTRIRLPDAMPIPSPTLVQEIHPTTRRSNTDLPRLRTESPYVIPRTTGIRKTKTAPIHSLIISSLPR
jgi:hypothetical protein